MDISKMNKRIKFVVISDETDEDGYPLSAEKVIRECWCSIRGLRGREFYNAAQTQSQDDKVFNCRYFKGLNKSMQIKYRDSIYNIQSINDLNERHIEYEIHAREVSSSG